jgi:hypothetical protein
MCLVIPFLSEEVLSCVSSFHSFSEPSWVKDLCDPGIIRLLSDRPSSVSSHLNCKTKDHRSTLPELQKEKLLSLTLFLYLMCPNHHSSKDQKQEDQGNEWPMAGLAVMWARATVSIRPPHMWPETQLSLRSLGF